MKYEVQGVVGNKAEKVCNDQFMMVFLYSAKELGCYSLAIVEDFQEGQFTRSDLCFRKTSLAKLGSTNYMGQYLIQAEYIKEIAFQS